MSKELSPKYNPAEVEAGRYQKWLDADVFKLQAIKRLSLILSYSTTKRTGKLHLGHAWGYNVAGYHHPSKTHARF